MNQAQRNFLIKKIEDNVKTKIDVLNRSKPDAPSVNTYLLHAVMSNNFTLKTTDELKEVLRQKALKSKDREDWLGNHWGTASKRQVVLDVDELFVIPEEYRKLREEYLDAIKSIDEETRNLRIQADTLITRIQLASDKTLQTMINEVDDMGNISLMDTKLKLLSNK